MLKIYLRLDILRDGYKNEKKYPIKKKRGNEKIVKKHKSLCAIESEEEKKKLRRRELRWVEIWRKFMRVPIVDVCTNNL